MTFRANDPLTEQIAQYLEKRIIIGELQPNERIQELRIASELEVSRGSVREALLILQRRHLIEIFPRRGAIVTCISGKNAHDFFEMWIMLLEKAAILVTQNWKRNDLADFSELMDKLQEHQHQRNLTLFYENGISFLRILYANVTNHYLSAVLIDLLPMTQRYLYAILRTGHSQMDYAWQLLQALMKALVARDVAATRHIVQQFGTSYIQLAHTSAETLARSSGLSSSASYS